MKQAGLAVLATALFMPIAVVVGDLIGKLRTVGHYAGPFPVTWVCGFSFAFLLPFLPFLLLGSVGTVAVVSCWPRLFANGAVSRLLLGFLIGAATAWGGTTLLGYLEGSDMVDALGGLAFAVMMTAWLTTLFYYISRQVAR